AGGGLEQPLEDLDGGGLAGAVGAEKTEALATAHLEIEAVHRQYLGGAALARVALPQPHAADGGRRLGDRIHGRRAQWRRRATSMTTGLPLSNRPAAPRKPCEASGLIWT